MKIYGYNVDGYREEEKDELLKLAEVSFQVTPEELRQLADFFSHCAATYESFGEKFGHEHFKDFKKIKDRSLPDVIVAGNHIGKK